MAKRHTISYTKQRQLLLAFPLGFQDAIIAGDSFIAEVVVKIDMERFWLLSTFGKVSTSIGKRVRVALAGESRNQVFSTQTFVIGECAGSESCL